MVVQLEKKADSSKVDAKRVAEQKVLMDAIVATLDVTNEPLTATKVAVGAGITVQRATALLKKLVTAGEVTRDDSGKKPLFTLS
jgi:predicted transcriptional regulator